MGRRLVVRPLYSSVVRHSRYSPRFATTSAPTAETAAFPAFLRVTVVPAAAPDVAVPAVPLAADGTASDPPFPNS